MSELVRPSARRMPISAERWVTELDIVLAMAVAKVCDVAGGSALGGTAQRTTARWLQGAGVLVDVLVRRHFVEFVGRT